MDTQENITSVQRDREILKLISKTHDNVQGLKDLIDHLTARIEKLKRGNNENK